MERTPETNNNEYFRGRVDLIESNDNSGRLKSNDVLGDSIRANENYGKITEEIPAIDMAEAEKYAQEIDEETKERILKGVTTGEKVVLNPGQNITRLLEQPANDDYELREKNEALARYIAEAKDVEAAKDVEREEHERRMHDGTERQKLLKELAYANGENAQKVLEQAGVSRLVQDDQGNFFAFDGTGKFMSTADILLNLYDAQITKDSEEELTDADEGSEEPKEEASESERAEDEVEMEIAKKSGPYGKEVYDVSSVDTTSEAGKMAFLLGVNENMSTVASERLERLRYGEMDRVEKNEPYLKMGVKNESDRQRLYDQSRDEMRGAKWAVGMLRDMDDRGVKDVRGEMSRLRNQYDAEVMEMFSRGLAVEEKDKKDELEEHVRQLDGMLRWLREKEA